MDPWRLAANRWPMPMVELEVEEEKTTIDAMINACAAVYDAFIVSERGLP